MKNIHLYTIVLANHQGNLEEQHENMTYVMNKCGIYIKKGTGLNFGVVWFMSLSVVY